MANTDPIAGTYNRILNLRAPAQEAPTPEPAAPGQDTDMLAQIQQGITPTLEQLLFEGVQAYRQGLYAPDKDDPQFVDPATGQFDSVLYAFALTDARQSAQEDLRGLMSLYHDAQQLADGIATLDDGTVITSQMLNSPDPLVAAQYRAAFENKSRSLLTGYNNLMNETGLAQYQVDLSATSVENDRRAKEFESALDAFDSGLDWDKANIGRTADVINRELSGMQESRARADLTTQALLSAAPWATTPGRTDYTADDFGAGVAGMVRLAGGDPGVPLIRFPTTVNIDPQALMAQGDAALGVGQGPLPAVPELTTPRSAVPLAPTYMQGPAAPQLSMPVPPTTAQEQIRAQQALIDTARLLGGRLGRIL